jgi:hypothetical protein
VTEPLLLAAARVALRNGACRTPKSDQPASSHQQQTLMQTSTRILTGSYGARDVRNMAS